MAKRYKRILPNLKEILARPDMSILPGQLAFFFILSLVPTITIIFYIASLLSISLEDITTYFNLGLNQDMISMLTPYVTNIEMGKGLFFLIGVGVYLASNGMNSIIVTADSIYGIEQKPFLERRIKAIIMVFIVILLFLFIVLVPIFGSFLSNVFENMTGYNVVYKVLGVLKFPFSWFTIFFFIKLLYTIAPDKEIPSSYVNTGALFTSIGWIIATEIYLYYVGLHTENYSLYYSGLSNIAILMMWIYILATIFVIGMGLNFKEEPYEEERIQSMREQMAAKKNQHKIAQKN